MLRKFMTVLAVSAFALTTLAPVDASAQRWRHHRDYGDAYGCRHDNNYGCERDRDRRLYGHGDDGDAVAAGVIGLVLGAVLVSALTSNGNDRNDGYYDGDRRGGDDYYRDSYANQRYADERYYEPAPPEPQCTRRERQWDRYANRYVTVDVPC